MLTSPAPARPSRWLALRAVAFGLFVMLTAEATRVFLGPNFHTVVPERCYRCSQPTPTSLEETARALGIRTVVNLRGRNEEEPWYWDEIAAAARLDVPLANAGLCAYYPNTRDDLRTLVRVLDESPEPILLHCHSGSDRSGLAAAVFLLLKTDATPEQARRQLCLRYGHNPWGKAGCHQAVFDGYLAWLAEKGQSHSPARFRTWLCDVYGS